jgi:hypothetical protein
MATMACQLLLQADVAHTLNALLQHMLTPNRRNSCSLLQLLQCGATDLHGDSV